MHGVAGVDRDKGRGAIAMRDRQACRSGFAGCSVAIDAALRGSLTTRLLAAGMDDDQQSWRRARRHRDARLR
jgi:hypothetical protein